MFNSCFRLLGVKVIDFSVQPHTSSLSTNNSNKGKRKWLLTTEEPLPGEEIVIAEVSELPEKCTRQSVLIAVLRPKFRSSQQKDDQFTAGNVFQSQATQRKPQILNSIYVTEFTSTLIYLSLFGQG